MLKSCVMNIAGCGLLSHSDYLNLHLLSGYLNEFTYLKWNIAYVTDLYDNASHFMPTLSTSYIMMYGRPIHFQVFSEI